MTVSIIWEVGMKIVPEPGRPPGKVCWWRLSNKPPRMWLRRNKVGFSVRDQPKVPWAWALLHQLPGGANPPISRLFRTPTLPADSYRWQFHSRIWQFWDSERGHLLWQEWLQAIQVVENVGQTLTADNRCLFSATTRGLRVTGMDRMTSSTTSETLPTSRRRTLDQGADITATTSGNSVQ